MRFGRDGQRIMEAQVYDVFLSYNSEDRDVVMEIASYLEEKRGLSPWLDRWHLIPGEPWFQNMERGLIASKTCAVFVGSSGEGPWQQKELAAALDRQARNPGFRVVPVLLPSGSAKPTLPALLAGNTWVEFRKPLDEEALWRLECGIRGVVPRPGRECVAGDRPSTESEQKPREVLKSGTDSILVAQPGGYVLVRIPGGAFMMGSAESGEGRYGYESPLREVRVADFYMGRYPVTNEQYGRFLAENRGVKEPEYWANRQLNQPRQPVVGVSWDEARRYAEWAGLRLPSEAEWEYACRAGTSTRFYIGDTDDDLSRAGWYKANSGSQLHPVGEKEPNRFGLYDMHGNVWEWLEDDWHESYKGAPADGTPWIDNPRGSDRVIRGGSWNYVAAGCRSADGYGIPPVFRSHGVGFRLSRSVALDP
jgi:formylglycine-generating enzyme required for sulfatase activity